MDVNEVTAKINCRSKSLEEHEAWLGTKWHNIERSTIILYLSITLYGIFFSSLTILRYYSFMTRAWDLGIFTQSLWTTLYANRFLYHTCELFINPSGSFFGVHFSPILFLIFPFYRIVTAPETLLVIQSFVLPLGAVPIYKLAREYAGGRTVGLLFSAVYLMYPAIHFVNWYDYHVQTFLPLFFGFVMYYVTRENWPRYFVFVFLSLIVEEHASWFIFATGFYIIWKFRRQILSSIRGKEPSGRNIIAVGVVTCVIGAVWYWFTLWQRNTFFPTSPEALNEFLGSPNFAILGAQDPLQIPWLVVTRPWSAIQALAFDGQYKLLYIALLFGPLAFFSFKAPSALIPALPWFGFSFLSQTMAHHALGHQYEAYVVAFVFASAILGLRKNFVKNPHLESMRSSLKKIVAFSLMFFFIASPLSVPVNLTFPGYTHIGIGPHEQQIYEVLSMVPSNASILIQDNIFTQVSHRVDAYVVPVWHIRSTIREIAIDFVNETMDKVDYILVDEKTDPLATDVVRSLLLTRPEFRLVAVRDDNTIFLFQRKR